MVKNMITFDNEIDLVDTLRKCDNICIEKIYFIYALKLHFNFKQFNFKDFNNFLGGDYE